MQNRVHHLNNHHLSIARGLHIQAKLTDSEKKLLELSARLEHLTIEKSALENRNNILEKVLVMRDQELSNFKAHDSSARHQACLLQPAFSMPALSRI